MSKHEYQAQVRRDHITIDVAPRLWLSILEEDGGYASNSCKEIALMRYIPPASLLDEGRAVCVPLNKWWDSDLDDGELAIDLEGLVSHYNAPEAVSEAHLVRQVLLLAMHYAQEVK